MLMVVAKNVLKDGVRDEVIGILDELIEKTHQEPGCIKYELYEKEGAPNVLTFIEEWESKEALESHIASEHFTRIIPLLATYCAEEVPFDIFLPIK